MNLDSKEIPTINPNSTFLSAKHLELSFGKKNILKDITFELKGKSVIGLVGRNGCGKSSLLKILDDRIDYDGGRIETKNNITIGYLAQDLEYDLDLTIGGVFGILEDRIEKVLQEYTLMQDGPEKYALENKISTHGWWNIRKNLETLSLEFEVPDWSKKLKTCSGGECRRISLVASLAPNYDILLLDEPTNHLDLESIQKLEKYTMKYTGCIVVISHDRSYLDKVCGEIWEIYSGKLYKHSGGYSKFMENKAIRLEIANKTEIRKNQYLKRELEWVRAGVKARGTKDKGRMQRFEELSAQGKIHRDSKAQMLLPEPTHIGARILDFKNVSLENDEQVLIDKFEFSFQKYHKIGIVGGNGVGKSTFLKLAMGILFDAEKEYHYSSNTLTADGLLPEMIISEKLKVKSEKSDTLISSSPQPSPAGKGDFWNSGEAGFIRPLEDVKDDEWIVPGKNVEAILYRQSENLVDVDSGQQGILKQVQNDSRFGVKDFSCAELELEKNSDEDFFEVEKSEDSEYKLTGTIKTGINTKFVYFDQSKVILDPERTPFEYLADYRDIINFGEEKINSRKYLHRWLFSKDQYNTPIKFLSGGERSRLILAKILAEGGNFLILDEPTNDLDLDTIRILEEAIYDYEGMVIVVSHDRYFLNRICNYVFGFEGKGNITVSTGNYDDYLNKKIDLDQVKSYHQKLKKEAKIAKSISNDAKLQIQRIESEIAMVETKIAEYTAAFEDVELYVKDPIRFNKLHKLLSEKERELERLMSKWSGLQELIVA
jgi:ATPase subunit of ABC transporter with duplicated ATPase domains